MKKKAAKALKPRYEKGKGSVITEKTTRADTKKVLSEMSDIIKENRKLEEKFRVRQNETLL